MLHGIVQHIEAIIGSERRVHVLFLFVLLEALHDAHGLHKEGPDLTQLQWRQVRDLKVPSPHDTLRLQTDADLRLARLADILQ